MHEELMELLIYYNIALLVLQLNDFLASDGVLEYHFLGTRTRNPWYSVSTRTQRSMYSVLGQKKRRVHKYIWLSLDVTN